MNKRTLCALLAGLLFVFLSVTLLIMEDSPESLAEASVEALPKTGVGNPVTAVLLAYRGYDTLLEVGVLLLVVIGVWSLRRSDPKPVDVHGRVLLQSFLRLVLPVLVLVGGYFLWIGSNGPGGAFQGGAMIGGALVLAISTGQMQWILKHPRKLRGGLAVGLTVFIVVAASALVVNGRILQYPESSAGSWILLIEAAALISIGLTLGALFAGGRPARELSPEPEFRKEKHD